MDLVIGDGGFWQRALRTPARASPSRSGGPSPSLSHLRLFVWRDRSASVMAGDSAVEISPENRKFEAQCGVDITPCHNLSHCISHDFNGVKSLAILEGMRMGMKMLIRPMYS
ncbi:hypothetical protein SAY87_012065 [Trapa incisa]|uniref:Uncharacterized protein n=1 Tax=Trapa incisa TaxID=236973 RepID=A0AAN7GJG3_9MYRT|nr:hypothetical protein SAY87_012065 [Trapa incisa]